jgi:hypothetical protein
LTKKLAKKGIEMSWSDSTANCEVEIRVLKVQQGNQFLRWLFPFIAPAVVEIEGQFALPGLPCQPFHRTETAQVGFLGGSASHMVGTCIDRLAYQLAYDIGEAIAKNG